MLLESDNLGSDPVSARPPLPNLQNGDDAVNNSACFHKVVGRWSTFRSVMRWARAVAPWLIHTSIQAAVFNWELCEVLVYRFRICLILTCIVCFLFPVKNITHDKFDNVDYLCWVTKIYDSYWLLFTFLLCHMKILPCPCNIWLEYELFWGCVLLLVVSLELHEGMPGP